MCANLYTHVSMYSGATCRIDHSVANCDVDTAVAAVGGGDTVTCLLHVYLSTCRMVFALAREIYFDEPSTTIIKAN